MKEGFSLIKKKSKGSQTLKIFLVNCENLQDIMHKVSRRDLIIAIERVSLFGQTFALFVL